MISAPTSSSADTLAMEDSSKVNNAGLDPDLAYLVQLQQLLLAANNSASVRPVSYPMSPGALSVGRFPSPQNVIRLLGNNAEAQKFLSRPAQVIIRMRGLPYDATSKHVVSIH